jgi:hypothetical protein
LDDRTLAEAAMYLRNAAPEQYAKFVEEFALLATQSAMVLVTSRPDTIMSDQGWAKAAQFFLRTFKDCQARVAAPKKPTAETPPR